MEQEKIEIEALTKKQKENNQMALLAAVALIAVLLLLSWFYQGGITASLQVNETNFEICADDGTSYLIA